MTNNILAKTLTVVGVISSLATSGIVGYKVFANHEVNALEIPKLSSLSPEVNSDVDSSLSVMTDPSPSVFPSFSPEISPFPFVSPDSFPIASPVGTGNLFEGSDDEDDKIQLEDHD